MEELNLIEKTSLGILLVLLCVLTVFGNCLVLYAVIVDKRLQTASNKFIVSLACSDVIVGLLVMPLSAASVLVGSWPLNEFTCYSWLICDYVASTASILNILLLCLDRYWSVTSPLKNLRRSTKRRATVLILISWALSCLWIGPILVYRVNVHPTPDTKLQMPDAKAAMSVYVSSPHENSTMHLSLLRRDSATQVGWPVLDSFISTPNSEKDNTSNPTSAFLSSNNSNVSTEASLLQATHPPGTSTPTHAQFPLGNATLPEETGDYAIVPESQTLSPANFPIQGIKTRTDLSTASTTSQFQHSVMNSTSRNQEFICDPGFSFDLPFKLVSSVVNYYIPLLLTFVLYARVYVEILNRRHLELMRIRGKHIENLAYSLRTSITPALPIAAQNQHPVQKGASAPAAPLGPNPAKVGPHVSSPGNASPPEANCLLDKAGSPADDEEHNSKPKSCLKQKNGRARANGPSAKASKRASGKSTFSLDLGHETKAARTLGMITGAFTVCFLPYFVIFVVMAATHVSLDVILAVTWFGYLNSTINPLLYSVSNHTFRERFKIILRMKQEVPNTYYNSMLFRSGLASLHSNKSHLADFTRRNLLSRRSNRPASPL